MKRKFKMNIKLETAEERKVRTGAEVYQGEIGKL